VGMGAAVPCPRDGSLPDGRRVVLDDLGAPRSDEDP
jgi:hypothetical protein